MMELCLYVSPKKIEIENHPNEFDRNVNPFVTCRSLSLTLESDSPTSLRSCASFTSNTIGVRPGFKTIGTTSSTCIVTQI